MQKALHFSVFFQRILYPGDHCCYSGNDDDDRNDNNCACSCDNTHLLHLLSSSLIG